MEPIKQNDLYTLFQKHTKDFTQPVILMTLPGLYNNAFRRYLRDNYQKFLGVKSSSIAKELRRAFTPAPHTSSGYVLPQWEKVLVDNIHNDNMHKKIVVVNHSSSVLKKLLARDVLDVIFLLPSKLEDPMFMYKEYIGELVKMDVGDLVTMATYQNYISWGQAIVEDYLKYRETIYQNRIDVLHLDVDFTVKRIGYEKESELSSTLGYPPRTSEEQNT